jgi:hypothetical protein
MRLARRALGWWFAPLPLARVAVLRAFIYLFLLFDITQLTNDVIPHSYAPDLYQPTLIGRVIPFPTPSPELSYTLLVVIVAGSLVVVTGRLPRIAGWSVAAAYFLWLLNSMGYGYVDHDHLALLVATLVLPTVGRARYTDQGSSEKVTWALRCIQICVIATYFGSAVAKWIRNGSPFVWMNSAVFTWAIMRRGSDLARQLLDVPWMLTLGQWGLYLAEFFSPVVLFLRGKALAFAAVGFVVFHALTFAALGIHFLPTVICWLAFFPLERLVPVAQRVAGRFRRPAPTAPGTAAT